MLIAALFLSSPLASLHAQTVEPTAERDAVGKVMHAYFEAYSQGDMPALMKFVHVPLTVMGPKGFRNLTTSNEALD